MRLAADSHTFVAVWAKPSVWTLDCYWQLFMLAPVQSFALCNNQPCCQHARLAG
jgi:hypothetical protein